MPDIFTESTDFDTERDLAATIKAACVALKTLITEKTADSEAQEIYEDMCSTIDILLCKEGVDMIPTLLGWAEEDNAVWSDPWKAEGAAYRASVL